jgi:integrase
LKGRINHSSLAKLVKSEKGKKREFLWDDRIYMFGAYQTTRGHIVFVYQFRMHPSQPTERLTIGKLGPLTPEQARSIAAAAALKVANGINPITERREALQKKQVDQSILLKNFAQHYLKVRIDGEGKRSAPDVRRVIEKDVCRHLGEKSIAEITIPMVEKMMQALSQRSPTAPRAALVQLKAVLKYAKDTHKIDRVLIDVLRPVIPPARERVLSSRELRRFVEALHDVGGIEADAVLCLLLLLKRRREVLSMHWREIDQENWVWRLPGSRSKNKEPETLILPPAAVTVLERQQPDPNCRTGFVFSFDGSRPISAGGDLKKKIDANMHRRIELAAAAGRAMPTVEHFNLHDLRTAGATTLQEKPFLVPPQVIEALLNHIGGKGKVQMKYQRGKYVEPIAETLVAWSEYIAKLMSDDDAWPGGKDLDPMSKEEIEARVASLRADWPKPVRGKDDGAGDDDN